MDKDKVSTYHDFIKKTWTNWWNRVYNWLSIYWSFADKIPGRNRL